MKKPAFRPLKISPWLQPCEGRPERRDPEYIRHGTRMLMASRDVATGQINAYTIGDERKEADFLNHVKEIVASDS